MKSKSVSNCNTLYCHFPALWATWSVSWIFHKLCAINEFLYVTVLTVLYRYHLLTSIAITQYFIICLFTTLTSTSIAGFCCQVTIASVQQPPEAPASDIHDINWHGPFSTVSGRIYLKQGFNPVNPWTMVLLSLVHCGDDTLSRKGTKSEFLTHV